MDPRDHCWNSQSSEFRGSGRRHYLEATSRTIKFTVHTSHTKLKVRVIIINS